MLTALAQAAMVQGSRVVAFGTRNLALYSGVSWRTVARVLEELRDEDDPLVELVTAHYLKRADRYVLRIPDAYAEAASWRRRRAGWITAIHPAFSELGGPAALTYAILTDREATAAEVARTARLGETAASGALRELAAHGLAERGQRGWRRGPAALDDVAIATGAMQAHVEQAGRYKADRDLWHETVDAWLAGPAPAATADVGWAPLFDDAIPYLEPPDDWTGDPGPPS